MTIDPADALDRVHDQVTFLEFIDALIASRIRDDAGERDICGRGPDGWENHTIETFLLAAAEWAKSTDFGASQGLVNSSPWRRFAVFLYCGKIYE